MHPDRLAADLQTLARLLRRQQLLSAGLLALAVLLAAANLTRRHTVVLEPPLRARSLTVVGDRYDAPGLEQMGEYIAHMMLDATPLSIARQHEEILRWTHPAFHGALQQAQAVLAKRLVDSNASTYFTLQQTAADAERQRVLLIGLLQTYVNGALVAGSQRNVNYVAEFAASGGRTLLKDWHETPADDPWAARALRETTRTLAPGEHITPASAR